MKKINELKIKEKILKEIIKDTENKEGSEIKKTIKQMLLENYQNQKKLQNLEV